MLDSIWQITRQPEYLHTLLNPVPIYGLGMGALGLAIALCLRSRRAQIATLAIIFVSAGVAFPVYRLGEAAEGRMEGIIDDAGRAWLEEHEARAEKVIYVFYALAALAAVALIAPAKWPASATMLSIAVLAVTALALGLGGYVAKAGGQIRHREFRTGALPDAGANDVGEADGGRGRGRRRGGRDR